MKTSPTHFCRFGMILWLLAGISLPSCHTVPDDGPRDPHTRSGEIDGIRFFETGNKADVETATRSGLCLMGGGQDVDAAMRWMIERCGGGDFVVIRTSGSSGYNEYIHDQLGGVDSVTTYLIDSRDKANSDAVVDKLRQAEALFIAGGDQTTYYDYWNETGVESAVQYLLADKKIPVGGTSAGMAVLTRFCYIPEFEGVYSSEALADPYHKNMNAIRSDFITVPFMDNTLTDTHFSERDREQTPPGRLGRTIAFLARILTDGESNSRILRAIACDEQTAVCIDEYGDARIFGSHPIRADYAFFFQCLSSPVICAAGQALHWPDAVRVYRVAGNQNGTNTFNLSNWEGQGGEWHAVSVVNGAISNDIQTPD